MFELEVRKEYPLVHIPDPVLYRYYLQAYASEVDEFDTPTGPGRKELKLQTFVILKRTPKGAWIRGGWPFSDKKFVNLTLHKKYACETKEDALRSYMDRTQNYIRILESRLTAAKLGLAYAEINLKEKI